MLRKKLPTAGAGRGFRTNPVGAKGIKQHQAQTGRLDNSSSLPHPLSPLPPQKSSLTTQVPGQALQISKKCDAQFVY